MNWERIEGNWNEVKGKVKQQWGKLTDDDLTQARGRREQVVARIQQRYGEAKEKVELELDRFIERL